MGRVLSLLLLLVVSIPNARAESGQWVEAVKDLRHTYDVQQKLGTSFQDKFGWGFAGVSLTLGVAGAALEVPTIERFNTAAFAVGGLALSANLLVGAWKVRQSGRVLRERVVAAGGWDHLDETSAESLLIEQAAWARKYRLWEQVLTVVAIEGMGGELALILAIGATDIASQVLWKVVVGMMVAAPVLVFVGPRSSTEEDILIKRVRVAAPRVPKVDLAPAIWRTPHGSAPGATLSLSW